MKFSFFKKYKLPYIFYIFFSAYIVTAGIRAYKLRRPSNEEPLSQQEKQKLEDILNLRFPDRNKLLKKLPYPVKPVSLNVGAKAAIAINAANGNILYEKNADELIPPASITKIAAMLVVSKEAASGRISFEDKVPLPPECWACNMPPHSSLMFLGKNQQVTVEELMMGLAVASGNDASYALAYYTSGGMQNFIDKMNEAVSSLGLTNTYFKEASGYSEKNITTARDTAVLSYAYISMFPENIKKFHSSLSFTYPKEHNLAPEDKGKPRYQDFSKGLPENITMGIYQENTNPLLGRLKGCDGLKTGYIEESGYNLILTAYRNGMRIISVTLGGKGTSTAEGNAERIKDGTEIMEWAFSAFSDYRNESILRPYSVPLIFAERQRAVLVPAYKPEALTVPTAAAINPSNALGEITVKVNIPKVIKGKVAAGTQFGYIEYKLNNNILEIIPLIAEKNINKARLWLCAADLTAQFALLK